MQEYLDIDHPCAGFMAAGDLHRSGSALPFAGFRNVAAECELAVRLALDLPPGPCTPDEARGAVGELFAAMEIVENRYGTPPIGDIKAVGTPTLIADQFYHAAAVLGEPAADWRTLDLVAIQGRAVVDGTERNAGRGAELLGDPMRALAWLAGSDVAAAFGGLRVGQVVMLGSADRTVRGGDAVRRIAAGALPLHLIGVCRKGDVNPGGATCAARQRIPRRRHAKMASTESTNADRNLGDV
jgi:2-keto-4-pentenoate hydratase